MTLELRRKKERKKACELMLVVHECMLILVERARINDLLVSLSLSLSLSLSFEALDWGKRKSPHGSLSSSKQSRISIEQDQRKLIRRLRVMFFIVSSFS
jgi:hypothetical protein